MFKNMSGDGTFERRSAQEHGEVKAYCKRVKGFRSSPCVLQVNHTAPRAENREVQVKIPEKPLRGCKHMIVPGTSRSDWNGNRHLLRVNKQAGIWKFTN